MACHGPEVLSLVHDIADTFKHIAPSLLDLAPDALDDSDASVHRLGAALTRECRDALHAETAFGHPETSLLAMLTIHGTVYVGRCAVQNHGGQWLFRRPLWESTVCIKSPFGDAELAIFQWWLKSLSDGEIDRLPLGPRYRSHVEIPCFDSDGLPTVALTLRDIPRISSPTHPTLIGHLKAHVPEIKSLGPDFPSPERFNELRFAWLDFMWLGEGRLLLMHGPARHQGAHLFWLNADGFVKAAFYPSDDVPSHMVKVVDDQIRVIVSVGNEVCNHDMPWWGL